MDFVKITEFDKVGVFEYSPEENTMSFDLKDPVAKEVKQNRINRLKASIQVYIRKNDNTTL